MSQKVIIYPGTFDPLTYGHIDIIERGAQTWRSIDCGCIAQSRQTAAFFN